MNLNRCPWAKDCLNGDSDCYTDNPEKCIRFLPLEGNNLTKISGVVETPPEIDGDKFSQYFINWIDSMGWHFAGAMTHYNEDE